MLVLKEPWPDVPTVVEDPPSIVMVRVALLLKNAPLTFSCSPGGTVVGLTRKYACGLHAHAIAAGTSTAALTASRTSARRRAVLAFTLPTGNAISPSSSPALPLSVQPGVKLSRVYPDRDLETRSGAGLSAPPD